MASKRLFFFVALVAVLFMSFVFYPDPARADEPPAAANPKGEVAAVSSTSKEGPTVPTEEAPKESLLEHALKGTAFAEAGFSLDLSAEVTGSFSAKGNRYNLGQYSDRLNGIRMNNVALSIIRSADRSKTIDFEGLLRGMYGTDASNYEGDGDPFGDGSISHQERYARGAVLANVGLAGAITETSSWEVIFGSQSSPFGKENFDPGPFNSKARGWYANPFRIEGVEGNLRFFEDKAKGEVPLTLTIGWITLDRYRFDVKYTVAHLGATVDLGTVKISANTAINDRFQLANLIIDLDLGRFNFSFDGGVSNHKLAATGQQVQCYSAAFYAWWNIDEAKKYRFGSRTEIIKDHPLVLRTGVPGTSVSESLDFVWSPDIEGYQFLEFAVEGKYTHIFDRGAGNRNDSDWVFSGGIRLLLGKK